MGNHVKVNGQLLQTNKKWSSLKEKQKEWISSQLKLQYIKIAEANNGYVSVMNATEIVNNVYEMIEEKGIWIPYGEVQKYFLSKTNKYKKSLKF